MPKFHTRYDRVNERSVKCGDAPCRVQPQFRELCNINNIVQRAIRGDATVYRKAQFADITSTPDSLHAALQAGVNARNAYDALPDAVRAAYPTPEAFFAACHDENQLDNLRRLGVCETPVEDTPIEVVVKNPVTPEKGA